MVKIDVESIRRLPPEERVKVLVDIEKKRKAALKKEQEEAESDVRAAEGLIRESLDEVAIEEELRRAREELKKTSVEEVVEVSREPLREEESLEEALAQAPVNRSGRGYVDVGDELERLSRGERSLTRGNLGALYSVLKHVEEAVQNEVYNGREPESDAYRIQDVGGIWSRVQELPKDEFGYKERMESVLSHIYELRKKSNDAYSRSDH